MLQAYKILGLQDLQLGTKLDYTRLHFIVLAPILIRLNLELLGGLQVQDLRMRIFQLFDYTHGVVVWRQYAVSEKNMREGEAGRQVVMDGYS